MTSSCGKRPGPGLPCSRLNRSELPFAFFAESSYDHGMEIGLVTREQIEALGAVAERLNAKGLEEESRAVREILAQLQRTPREVPASTAAEILHVTPQTIRNWVRGGILHGRRDRTGHFHVSLDALEPTIRLNQLMPNVPEELVAISDDEIDAEIQAVRAARRIAAARE